MNSRNKVVFHPKKAERLQLFLSKNVIYEDRLPECIKYVAGVDASYTKSYSVGAVSVLDYDTMKEIEVKTSWKKISVPYIPTLLSFREMPSCISAVKKLKRRPDIILVDGHGFAHPRHLGYASHLGLVLNTPTIGVAKNILFGTILNNIGDIKKIVYDDKTIGVALTPKSYRKPIYVSIGHKISLETAVDITIHCLRKHRIPEPLRAAHIAANKERMKVMS